MKYIDTLREGERVGGIYLCKHKQHALTKNGKPYVSLILQDKTGTLDAKVWDPNSQGIDDFEALDYLEVVGDVISFQGALQMNIKRIRKAQEGEFDPKEYLPVSDRDLNEMYQELAALIHKIENPHLKSLAEGFFLKDSDFQERFQHHSAAKSVHHGFVGGLLEHTLSVMQLCSHFASTYQILNRDLLLTAALFHDIGKLEEISDFPANAYTDDGQLLGHIMIGSEMVGARIRTMEGFPPKLAAELKHCILAHHGELEFGSPKKPALPEAIALSFADNLDAKMETLKELFAAAPAGSTEWLGYNRLLESNIRKSSLS